MAKIFLDEFGDMLPFEFAAERFSVACEEGWQRAFQYNSGGPYGPADDRPE